MFFHMLDYEVNPDIFLIKTEASGSSWKYEKIQAGMSDDHFVFALKAEKDCRVCLLYSPGYLQDDGGWCVVIGQ